MTRKSGGGQGMLGIQIPQHVSWTCRDGPSMPLRLTGKLDINIDPQQFLHCLVMGLPGFGKGVFCSTLGLYLRDNLHWKFIDFFDQNANYENGCYLYEQHDETMLARIEDTFPLVKPCAYPFNMLIPRGTLKRYPSFFDEFTIGYHELLASDFNAFYTRGTGDTDITFQSDLATAESVEDCVDAVKKNLPAAYSTVNELAEWGTLADETNLDYKALADWRIIHSFSMAPIVDKRTRDFVNNTVVRLIYESRFNKSYDPCTFYVREAGGLDDISARLITTRGRHAGVHFLADTQRRVGMLEKTTGMMFSSQFYLKMTGEQGAEALGAAGLNVKLAKELEGATPGIGILNLAGEGIIKPLAVAPPASMYKPPNTDYFKICRSLGAKFKSSRYYYSEKD